MKFHVTASPALTVTLPGLKLSFWTFTLAGAARAGVAKAHAARAAPVRGIDAARRTTTSSREVGTAGNDQTGNQRIPRSARVVPAAAAADARARIEHPSRAPGRPRGRPGAPGQAAAASRKPVTARR